MLSKALYYKLALHIGKWRWHEMCCYQQVPPSKNTTNTNHTLLHTHFVKIPYIHTNYVKNPTSPSSHQLQLQIPVACPCFYMDTKLFKTFKRDKHWAVNRKQQKVKQKMYIGIITMIVFFFSNIWKYFVVDWSTDDSRANS